MSFPAECPFCKHVFLVKDKSAEATLTCPQCQRPFPAALGRQTGGSQGSSPRLGILMGHPAGSAVTAPPRRLTTLVTDIVGRVIGKNPAAKPRVVGSEFSVIALTLGMTALVMAWPLRQGWPGVLLGGLGLVVAGAIALPLAWRGAASLGPPVVALLVNVQVVILAFLSMYEEPTTVSPPTSPPLIDFRADLSSPNAVTRQRAIKEVGDIAGQLSETLGDLLPALQDDNPEIRAAAAAALGKLGPQARLAYPGLEQAARSDMSETVRRRSREALQKIGGHGGDLAELLVGLKDARAPLRAAAAQAIGSVGSEAREAIPALGKALLDPDADVRISSAQALWLVQKKQGRELLDILVRGLDDPDRSVRSRAAATLGSMRRLPSQVLEPLCRALHDKDAGVRIQAAFALGSLESGAKRAVPALIEALADKDAKVQLVAAQALWVLDRQSQGVSVLAHALKNPQTEIRVNAALALGKFGKQARLAVPALAECLRDADAGVRARAAEALSEIGADAAEAVPALIQALRHDDPDFRAQAAFALSGIGPEARSALGQLQKNLEDKNAGARLFAAQALWKLEGKEKEILPVVLEILRDHKASSYLRKNAAMILGLMGTHAAAAVPALHELFKETDADLRAAAAKALGDIGGPFARVAFPTLMELGREEQADEAVRQAAAAAARKIGRPTKADVDILTRALSPKYPASFRASATVCLWLLQRQAKPAVEALSDRLQDPEPTVRATAAIALAGIGPDAADAVPALTKALASPDELLRTRAADALAAIGTGGKPAVPELRKIMDNEKEKLSLRLSVAQALWAITGEAEELIPILSKGLKEEDAAAAIKAAQTLARIGPAAEKNKKGQEELAREAIPALRAALQGEHEAVRPAAAAALGELGYAARPALPFLVRGLDEADGDLRAALAEAIGKIADAEARVDRKDMRSKTAYSALLFYSKVAPGDQVQKAANVALARIGQPGPDDAPMLMDIIEDRTQPVFFRVRAAQVLGLIGPGAANVAPRLSNVIKQAGDAEVRALAAYGLGEIGPLAKKEAPVLVQVLKEGEPVLQGAAAYALGELYQANAKTPRQILARLEIAVESPDANVAAAATAALKKITKR